MARTRQFEPPDAAHDQPYGVVSSLNKGLVALLTLSVVVSVLALCAVVWQGWIAQDTEKRQVRAYAYATPAGLKDFEVGKAPVGAVAIRIMGQTPAYNVRGKISVAPLPYPPSDSVDAGMKTVRAHDQVLNSTLLGLGTVFTLEAPTDAALTRETMDSLSSGSSRVYMWGEANYEDSFGQAHWLTFCYIYDSGGQSADMCPWHNTDDHH
ncbi:MAG TPA: hypothetical protein VH855_17530 [Acetobacteraceae bacterium]|jgi:hypothetical protein